MRFADLDRMGAPARVREAGLLKSAGRDYPAADGDILFFRLSR
jgi:ribosome-binding ATPase YchF (GTP1/OBG family)